MNSINSKLFYESPIFRDAFLPFFHRNSNSEWIELENLFEQIEKNFSSFNFTMKNSNLTVAPDSKTIAVRIFVGIVEFLVFAVGTPANLLVLYLTFEIFRRRSKNPIGDGRQFQNGQFFVLTMTAFDLFFCLIHAPMMFVMLVLIDHVPLTSTACIVMYFVTHASTTGSSLSLLALNIEKFVRLYKPLHYRSIVTRRRTIFANVLIWFLSIGWGAFLMFGPFMTNQVTTKGQCYQTLKHPGIYVFFAAQFFVLPTIISLAISGFTLLAALKTRRHRNLLIKEKIPKILLSQEMVPKIKETVPRAFLNHGKVPEKTPEKVLNGEKVSGNLLGRETVPKILINYEKVPGNFSSEEKIPQTLADGEKVPQILVNEEKVPKNLLNQEKISHTISNPLKVAQNPLNPQKSSQSLLTAPKIISSKNQKVTLKITESRIHFSNKPRKDKNSCLSLLAFVGFVFTTTVWTSVTSLPYRVGYLWTVMNPYSSYETVICIFTLFAVMVLNAAGNPFITIATKRQYSSKVWRMFNKFKGTSGGWKTTSTKLSEASGRTSPMEKRFRREVNSV